MSRSTTCVIRDEGEDDADERINQLLSTAQSFSKLVLKLSIAQNFFNLVFPIVSFREKLSMTANFKLSHSPNLNLMSELHFAKK